MSQPVDFARDDPGAIAAQVRLLAATALYFNVLAVAEFGGRAGPVREPGLVEQVVGAAFQGYGGHDPHPGPFDKAAMLLRGIAQGHPFEDGNKRTGFLLAAYYLEAVGHPLPELFDVDAVEQLCLLVSAGELRDVGLIADELRQLWRGG